MNYATLSARLLAFLAEGGATDDTWATVLPAIIEAGELRCYRSADFLATRRVSTVGVTAGAYTVSAPSDWLIGRDIVLTGNGLTLMPERRDDTFLRAYWPDRSQMGQPKYWAEPTPATLMLAPTSDGAYAVELSYTSRPAPMTDGNPTTWLGDNAPDLLFYACMIAATGYQKNFGAQADDPRSAMSWEQQFQAALTVVRNEESRRRGSGTFDNGPSAPTATATPPG